MACNLRNTQLRARGQRRPHGFDSKTRRQHDCHRQDSMLGEGRRRGGGGRMIQSSPVRLSHSARVSPRNQFICPLIGRPRSAWPMSLWKTSSLPGKISCEENGPASELNRLYRIPVLYTTHTSCSFQVFSGDRWLPLYLRMRSVKLP